MLTGEVSSMNKGDEKHVEIDDRISIFLICMGDNRYTGWVYYVDGDLACYNFKNAPLEEIVRDGYERGVFNLMSEGSLYNTAKVSELQQTIDAPLASNTVEEAPLITQEILEKDVLHSRPANWFPPEMLNTLINDFGPRQADVYNLSPGHTVIQIYKSKENKMKKSESTNQETNQTTPELKEEDIFKPYRVADLPHEMSSNLDNEVMAQFNSEQVKFEASKIETKTSNEPIVKESPSFQDLSYQDQMHRLYIDANIKQAPNKMSRE